MSLVRIATRGSDLALAQARSTAARIRDRLAVETELVVIQTTGDRIQNVSLAKVGGKGLFVKEIEEALLDDRADVAVHSAKDLPADRPSGLRLVAFPERVDPRDALIGREPDVTLAGLRSGARVGTGSARRTALLLCARKDIEVLPMRGNVPTRLRKLEEQELDAIVLACAGLERLGLADCITERISTEQLLPAVCQGALALEAREGEALSDDLETLNDPTTSAAVTAERAFLARLEGDCTVPLAAHAEVTSDGALWMRGLVASSDGDRVARAEGLEPAKNAEALGRQVAETVLEGGGRQILDALRDGSEP